MSDYWYFARYMLAERWRLVMALVAALLSAGGLGVGLVTITPVLQVIFAGSKERTSLAAGGVSGSGGAVQAIAGQAQAGQPAVVAKDLPELARELNGHLHGLIPSAWIDALPVGAYNAVLGVMIFLAILTVFGSFFNFLHSYLSLTIIGRTTKRIRDECFARVLDSSLADMSRTGPSVQVRRVINDSTIVASGFNSLLGKLVAQLTKGMVAVVAAFLTDWRLAIAAVLVAPVMYQIIRKTGKVIRRGTRDSLTSTSSLYRIAADAFNHLRVVKSSTAERQEVERFEVASADLLKQELRVRTAKAISTPLIETMALFVLGILAVIAAKAILDGKLEPSALLATFASLGVAGAALRPLTGFVAEMQVSSAAAAQLREILNLQRETDRDQGKPSLVRHRVAIEFQRVTYTYPPSAAGERAELAGGVPPGTPAVREVSLVIPHGKRYAFVGPNGCGKTTLLSLVPRLLEPDGVDGGRVVIDGVDIATVNRKSLREQIGVVTQEVVLFPGTIASNVRYGAPNASDAQVVDACKKARADEFIAAKAEGYQAPIGENGAGLSGGQKQRLSIARAILRDPAILILDEATSMIDADSESKINEALDEFGKGRTCLVVAHRLSTVLHSDAIVVMNQGRIEDVGTHEELLKRCPTYQLIARTQLLGE